MLFRLECKKIVRSAAFLIYCVISVLFIATNYYSDCKGGVYFGEGTKIVEDHELIMYGALNSLMGEYAANKYVCYPFGYYKAVHLKEKDQQKIAGYLREMTGTDEKEFEELLSTGEKYYVGMSDKPVYGFHDVRMTEGFSYDRFLEIMTDTDDMLGGGSDYAPDSLLALYSGVDMTDEELKEEYRAFIEDDKVTGGLARLFCDYVGIDLAILPVFVAAWLTSADRKRRMHELVYTRKISSAKLVFTRYAALVFTMFIPVVLEMIVALIQAVVEYNGESLDMTAMFTLPTFWLLPNLLFTTAAGVLITEVFSAPAAIFAQVVIWFKATITASRMLSGKIGRFDLVCRHNSPTDRSAFLMNHDNFIFSRIFWTVISLVLVVLAVYAYDAKRGGRFNGIRLFGKGGLLRRKA
ncbi:MAG: ABC transporter permease [Ruminococcus sp.]|nr:ABC transporter permease [Ruminococcus sp.]